ncbi:MAG: Disulfide bond formation protein B [Chlamydiia bacterium]|nr:Disulfide bond formation protein B [Chlamydiia bacterium]MCH9617900.1 Disulfide bond formation protein B [Chlamydiia bacterium]MCH9624116.1 Disulfide bond formation protein B [Chlamydiia bacterium]
MRVLATFNALILYGLVFVMCFSYYVEYSLGLPPCPLCLLQRFFMMGIGTCLMLNISGKLGFKNIAAAILSCILGSIVSLYQWSMLLTNNGISYAPQLFSLPLYIWSAALFLSTSLVLFIMLFFMKESACVPRNAFINLAYVLFLVALISEVITTYLSSGLFFTV